MKTVDEIRRENLEALVSEFGSAAAIAAKLDLLTGKGRAGSIYISQIRTGAIDTKSGKQRQLGAKKARELEKACGKPRGWMDADHSGSQSPVVYIPGAGSGMTVAAAIAFLGARLQAMDELSRAQAEVFLTRLARHPEEAADIARRFEAAIPEPSEGKRQAA